MKWLAGVGWFETHEGKSKSSCSVVSSIKTEVLFDVLIVKFAVHEINLGLI